MAAKIVDSWKLTVYFEIRTTMSSDALNIFVILFSQFEVETFNFQQKIIFYLKKSKHC